jgi:hypothetical protein
MKQKISQLQEQVGQTRKTAVEAQQKAEAAAQVQPVAPVPSSAPATHNFTMVGDAEVQYEPSRPLRQTFMNWQLG